MKHRLILLFVGMILSANLYAQQDTYPFEPEIKAFLKQDSAKFPAKNGILFIGSSSIRKWTDLEQRYPSQPIIRRGVGGSELWEFVSYYTPYIVFPYKPRKIFIYVGENDIASGKGSFFVMEQFKLLFQAITKKLPDATVYFMSLKPSPARAKYYAEVAKTNEMVKAYLANKPKAKYIEMATSTQKTNGTGPDSSLFEKDYIHLNKQGYDRWQKVLDPYVN